MHFWGPWKPYPEPTCFDDRIDEVKVETGQRNTEATELMFVTR